MFASVSSRLRARLSGGRIAAGVLLLLLIVAASAAAHPALDLSPEEAAWRSAHPTLRVGVFAGDHMPLEAWMGGQPEGLGIDYARLLASRAGLQIAFHPFTDWDAVASPSARQPPPFDLLLALPETRGSDGQLRLLRPYLSAAPVLVTRRNDARTRDLRDLDRARILIERRFHETVARLRQRYPHAVLLYCDTGPQCLENLARGEADAYIGVTAARTRALLASRQTPDLGLSGSAGLPALTFSPAVRVDAAPLASLLDKAAATIDADELERLRFRWGFGDASDDGSASPTSLSEAESRRLRALPVLRVGFEVDRYPYSFVDGEGRFDGLAADYLAHLGDQLGLRLQPVPARDWDDLQQMIRAGEIELVAAGTPDDFHQDDVAFSRPYEYFPEVIVVSVHGPAIAGARDLDGRVVAIRDEAGLIDRLQAQLGRTTFRPVGSNEAGLAMVAEQQADAYIGTLPAIDSLIRNHYAATLRVVGPAGLDQELAFGARGDFQGLVPLFDRVLANMPPSQKRAIRARWLTSSYHYGVPWDWVAGGIVTALLIIAIVVLAYARLHRLSRARVRAERALGAQLSFQRALLESVPYPIFVKDADDRYLAVNQAYETMFGCRRETLLGHRLDQVHLDPQADLAGMRTADSALAAWKEPGHGELRLPSRKPGVPARSMIVWSHPFQYHADGPPGRLATLVDVSEIRAAQARARSSEQRLSDITDAIPATVFQFRLSPQGERRFIYAAGNVRSLLGLSAEELVADERLLYDRLHPDDRQRLLQALKETADTLRPLPSLDLRLWTGERWHWLRTEAGQPRPLPDGTLEWSGYWIDIDAAHAQEQALHDAKARAESAAAAKAAFLASMSHEIRTPMAGVLGLIELLARTPMNREQAHMLRLADDSAQAMLQILDDILDYSRIEAGRLAISRQPFDPRALVDSVAGLFSARAQEKHLRLHVVQDRRLSARLLGDPVRIRQVLSNLVSNAIKFTETGEVSMTLMVVDEQAGQQRLRFTITDSGIGIATDDLAQLFHPFVQAEATSARPSGGTGLGLAISRRIATLMHGDLHLASEPGAGTEAVFELTLPIAEPLQPSPAFRGRRAWLRSCDPWRSKGLFHSLSALGFQVLRSEGDATEPPPEGIDLLVIDACALSPAGCSQGVPCIRVDLQGPREGVSGQACIALPGDPLFHHAIADACGEALGLQDAAEVTTSVSHRTDGNGYILVAEDHPVNRALITRQLERLGYAHRVVEDGVQALAVIASGGVDLLLTDCHMPGLDGFALARRIREEEGPGRHLPIIALSASALPEQVRRCLDAGMDDFLAKPVQLEQLAGKLEQHLRKRAGLPALPTAQAAGTASEIRPTLAADAMGAWVNDLVAACREDLARLDALPSSDIAARRALLHRMEGALALVMPIPEGDPFSADIRDLGAREHWVRKQVQALRASPSPGGGHVAIA
nr:transporter substrate-binding domain-containing protein [Pseudoxanthomonas sp.]